MTIHAIDAVEVRCDGCGGRMEYGDDYSFWLRDQAPDWVSECGWVEEDGKHYCQTNAPNYDAAVCWPPSMRDAHAAGKRA
jgi:hypothetical protein